jgi:hypothetical protein
MGINYGTMGMLVWYGVRYVYCKETGDVSQYLSIVFNSMFIGTFPSHMFFWYEMILNEGSYIVCLINDY